MAVFKCTEAGMLDPKLKITAYHPITEVETKSLVLWEFFDVVLYPASRETTIQCCCVWQSTETCGHLENRLERPAGYLCKTSSKCPSLGSNSAMCYSNVICFFSGSNEREYNFKTFTNTSLQNLQLVFSYFTAHIQMVWLSFLYFFAHSSAEIMTFHFDHKKEKVLAQH